MSKTKGNIYEGTLHRFVIVRRDGTYFAQRSDANDAKGLIFGYSVYSLLATGKKRLNHFQRIQCVVGEGDVTPIFAALCKQIRPPIRRKAYASNGSNTIDGGQSAQKPTVWVVIFVMNVLVNVI